MAEKVGFLAGDPDSRWVLGQISTRDSNERSQALDQLAVWLNGLLESPSEPGGDPPAEAENCIGAACKIDQAQTNHIILVKHLASILRLSIQCPFDDVKEKCRLFLGDFRTTGGSGGHTKDCKKVVTMTAQSGLVPLSRTRKIEDCEQLELTEEHYWDRLGMIVDHPHCSRCRQNLREKGIKVPRQCGNGPSSFIPASEFLTEQNGRDEEQARELFIEVFLQTNRLDHLTTVMGLHPSYLDAFLRTQDYMLRGDGPLPFDYRHYIAILAAARNSCSYIVRLQESEFLLQGGDPEWLKGIQHTPQKLQNLYEFIKFVAHQPWLITKDLIERLLKGSHNWALSELVHALVIATQFSSVSSFTFGCGINLEVDMEGGHTLRPPSFTDSSITEDGLSNNNYSEEMLSGNVETIMKRMKELSEAEEPEDSQEEKMKKFERVEKQNVELVSPSVEEQNRLQADLSHYLRDPDFGYKDFAKRGELTAIPTFRAQDYSWEDHGFSLVNRYYTDTAPLLDDKFRLAYNLTYNTMGKKKQVDTSLLRRAIWNYIHSLFGIRHDDYDYGEVNSLLDRNLKTYIKTVTCYPEKAGMKDYEGFWRDFKHSEKVHVNMMILEARMQASLLYCLRAIMRYMT